MHIKIKITILFLVFGVYSSTEHNDSLDKIQMQTNYPKTSIDKILPQQALEMNQNNVATPTTNNQNNEIVPYQSEQNDNQLVQKLEEAWQAEHGVANQEENDEENQNCCQKWFIEKNEEFQDHIWNTRYYLKQKKCGKKCRKALKIALIPAVLPIALFIVYPEITSAIIWLILQFGVKPNVCKTENCTSIETAQHVFLATFLIGLLYRIAQRIGKKVNKKVDRFVNPLSPSPKRKYFWKNNY